MIGPDAPEWSAVLADNRHDVYHLPGYVSADARQEGGTPAAVLVEDGEDHRLLLPLIVRELGDGYRDAVSAYGYSGPIADAAIGSRSIAPAMAAAVAALRDADIVALFVRLHPLLPLDGLDAAGTVVNHGPTVVIDLSRSEEELWRTTRQNHRRDIRKAEQAGHAFAFEASPEAFAAFKGLYRATMARRQASDRYAFDDAYFEELDTALSGRLHLATVRIEGNVAAAGLFTECCGIVQLHLSGSSDTHADARPTKLLYHGVRTWAKRAGLRWFHLGGGVGAEQDSLLHFKAGFSPDRRDFQTLRIVVREDAYRDLVMARTDVLDPSELTGYFPAYDRDGSSAGSNGHRLKA